MVLPDRVPVAQPLDVVPHPVGVDHPRAGRLGDAEHPAVDVGRHAGDHRPRRRAEPVAGQALRTRSWSPPMPPLVTITAWPRSSKSPTSSRLVGRPRSGAVGRQGPALDAGHGPAVDHQAVDAVPEPQRDPARSATCSRTRFSNGSTTPGPVPQVRWNRGTELPCPLGPAVAALGPADDREDPVAHAAQPRPLLAGREVDVRLGPGARPAVLLAVELRAAHPVLQRELVGVLDAHPALLGAVDEEQPAEATRTPARPRLCSPSWSSSSTDRPASATSAAATSPASPAPTTMTSASTGGESSGAFGSPYALRAPTARTSLRRRCSQDDQYSVAPASSECTHSEHANHASTSETRH